MVPKSEKKIDKKLGENGTSTFGFDAVLKLKIDEKRSLDLGAGKKFEDKFLVEKWYFDVWF